MSAVEGSNSSLSTRLNIQKLIHFCCNSVIKAEWERSIERTYFRWSIPGNDIYIAWIFMGSKKDGDTLRRTGGVDRLQVELKQCERIWVHTHDHTRSLAHYGCLNPHSPPPNHRIVSSRWQSQGFSTYKHFFWNNLPNASFKDVHVFYLVTSWRQGPRFSPSSKTQTALWNEELCQRINV